MSGLLRRAQDYLEAQRNFRIVRSDGDPFEEFEGSAEERAEIEAELQRIVEDSRAQIGPEELAVKPERHGSVLPVMVNLVAAIIIAAGIFALLRLFNSQEAGLVADTGALVSAEGRVLQELRQESEEQLSAKEAEIQSIQARLGEIESERESIREQAQQELEDRESQLRREFETALETERARLSEEQLSDTERAQQLERFQADQEALLAARISEVQAQAEADLQARESALASMVEEFEDSLAAAQAERTSLEQQLVEREAELTAEFQQREAQLARDRTAAVELLEELQAQQAQQQLVLDQILSLYSRIRTSLTSGALNVARSDLDQLREYLTSGPPASIPEFQRRRQVELFLVETLAQRIERATAADEPVTQTLVQSAALVAEVGELVSQANDLYDEGSISQARELYAAALSEIPAVRLGFGRLEAIRESVAAAESDRITSLIDSGNALYRSGDYQAAVATYGQALATLPAPDDAILNRILDAGYQLQAADTIEELENVRDELTSALARSQADLRESRSALETSRSALAAAGNELQGAREELRLTTARLATAESSLDQARTRLAAREDELVSARDELASARADLQATQAELQTARADLTLARTQSEAQNAGRISELEAEVDRLEIEVADYETELAAVRRELAASQVAMTSARQDLERSQAALETTRATLEERSQELRENQEDLFAAGVTAESLQAELRSTRELLDQANSELDASATEVALLQARLQDQVSLVRRIQSYQEQFQDVTTAGSEQPSALELLEAKLTILRAISSETVQADYPDLADQLDEFLDDLVENQRSAAVRQTLSDVNAILSVIAVGGTQSADDVLALSDRYPSLASAATDDDAQRFFASLKTIAQPDASVE